MPEINSSAAQTQKTSISRLESPSVRQPMGIVSTFRTGRTEKLMSHSKTAMAATAPYEVNDAPGMISVVSQTASAQAMSRRMFFSRNDMKILFLSAAADVSAGDSNIII